MVAAAVRPSRGRRHGLTRIERLWHVVLERAWVGDTPSEEVVMTSGEEVALGLGVTDRILDRLRGLVGVDRVFGEPVERNGATIIPAAKIRTGGGGGGGGGGDDEAMGSGEGGGFGVIAKPVGAFVIGADGDVRWEASIDVNQVVTTSAVVLILLALFMRRRRRS